MSNLIKFVEDKHLKKKAPKFDVGDTVTVKVLIREGKKERIQAFEGVVIGMSGGSVNRSFIVRRVFQGIGVERTFMLHSPKVQDVKVIRSGKTRRAKLYFLRERIGSKASRLQEDAAKTAQKFQEAAVEKAKAVEEEKIRVAAKLKADEEAKKAAEAEAKAKATEEAKAEPEAEKKD